MTEENVVWSRWTRVGGLVPYSALAAIALVVALVLETNTTSNDLHQELFGAVAVDDTFPLQLLVPENIVLNGGKAKVYSFPWSVIHYVLLARQESASLQGFLKTCLSLVPVPTQESYSLEVVQSRQASLCPSPNFVKKLKRPTSVPYGTVHPFAHPEEKHQNACTYCIEYGTSNVHHQVEEWVVDPQFQRTCVLNPADPERLQIAMSGIILPCMAKIGTGF